MRCSSGMNTFRERFPVAVDLSDSRSFVAVQLMAQKQIPVLRSSRYQEADSGTAPADAGAATEDFLRNVLRDPSFRGRSVSLIPALDEVYCYPLTVTPGPQETLEGALVREAAPRLDFPIEEAVLDYVSLSPAADAARGAQNVLLVAMRKDYIFRYVDLVRAAGGVLEIIDSAAAALVRAHSLTSHDRHQPAILCYTGRSQSALVVATDDRILAHRNLNWGIDRLKQKLSDNLKLDRASPDIDFLLRKHGVVYAAAEHDGTAVATGDTVSRTVSQLLEPLVDDFVHELHSLIGYIRSTEAAVTFGALYLYGEAASIDGLASYIGAELNLDCEAVNPLQNIGLRDTNSIATISGSGNHALALGLGLRTFAWL